MFNIGDKVRRVHGSWDGVNPGDVGVISEYGQAANVLRLEGSGASHVASVFELVTSATVPQVAGRKDDSGKLDMTLFDDMPRAFEAVAEVMQWAITKKEPTPYVRGSWLGVAPDRYRAAILRHNLAATKQAGASTIGQRDTVSPNTPARFQRDDETKLLHLAHVACSALFALELTLREMESNDNAK